MIYTLADKQFLLEEVFSVGCINWDDYHKGTLEIMSKGGAKIKCTFEINEEERKEAPEVYSKKFILRVEKNITDFVNTWASVNNK